MLMLNLAGVVGDRLGKKIAGAEEAALDLRAQVVVSMLISESSGLVVLMLILLMLLMISWGSL